jgi:hypothetical protein
MMSRSSKGIVEVPKFQRCELRGQLFGLKSNTAGDWMVTLRIDADCDEQVTKLAKAHGLALDIDVRRKQRDDG